MSTIRRCEVDADLAAHAKVWSDVHPDSPISAEEVQRRWTARDDGRVYFLAETGGRAAGVGFASRTSVPGRAAVLVAVRPQERGRGIGSELLEASLEHAAALGESTAAGSLAEAMLPWAERRGFREFDREVEFHLELEGVERPPEPLDGVRIVELQDEHVEGAFAVFAEGVSDMPSDESLSVSYDRWRVEAAQAPLVLAALDGDRVVGYAQLERRTDEVLGHELTAVARSHRRRGIARALKQTQIAWAGGCGYRWLITGTHAANEATRRLNESLGYRALPPVVSVRKELR